MSVKELFDTVQFVVNRDGQPQAAVLDMKTWNSLVALLEEVDDQKVVRERTMNWRTKEGWSRWEEFTE